MVDLDPNAHLFSLNDPGSGSLNGSEVVQQSTSNGVNTYTNDNLIVQPNGQDFWSSLGAGESVEIVSITAAPLAAGNDNQDFTGNVSFPDFNGDGKTDFIRKEKGGQANNDIRTAEVYFGVA